MFTCFWHLWSWLDPPVTSPLASPAVITMASIKKSGVGSGVSPSGAGPPVGGVGTPTRRNSQVRSPCIKRLPSAPVTLQGWLHKQGSDGLMLWKKRWFVLSDYCLFYYKGQEEEKLLGSILLPSYRISPCSSDDKLYSRKFSFKAEHANMRTYYFAAESQQQMAQWMNALSLASILQDSANCWDEHRSGGSTNNRNNINNNNNTSDSDSGFQPNQRLQPHHTYNDIPSQNTNNSWQTCHTNMQLPPGYQPLYANAPPKPRRLNDSSSTERSPERHHDDVGGRTSRMGAQPQQETYNRGVPQQETYNRGPVNVQPQQGVVYNAQHSHHRTVNNLYVINNISSCNNPNVVSTAQLMNNSERRTPDTYGRSNNATPCAQQAVRVKQRSADYEDVYQNNPDLVANTNVHHRGCQSPYHPGGSIPGGAGGSIQYLPGGTSSYLPGATGGSSPYQPGGSISHQPGGTSSYLPGGTGGTSPYQPGVIGGATGAYQPGVIGGTISYQPEGPGAYQVQYRRYQAQESVEERQRRFQVRPHSADFLEYDTRYHSPTPQSSERDSYDGRPVRPQSQRRVSGSAQQKPRPKSSMEIAHPSDFDTQQHWSEESYARKMRQSASFVAPQIQVPNASSRATTPSLKQVAFPGVGSMPYDAAVSYNHTKSQGSATMRSHCEVIERQERKWNDYVESRGTVPFVRSASARLARQLPDDLDFDPKVTHPDNLMETGQLAFKRRNSTEPRESGTKIQQREESMKRLLEWKQRMLQSPLTRKNSGSSSAGGRSTTHQELKHYKQQLALSADHQSAVQLSAVNSTADQLSAVDHQRAVSTMPEMRSSRRKEDQALRSASTRSRDDQASRSASTRSRSQDGRRSASLANRYTSYSSDDEEVQESRESWKRTRRLSQQQPKTIRPDNWEGKQAAANYENLELARSVDHSPSTNQKPSSNSSSNQKPRTGDSSNSSTNQKPRIGEAKTVSFERSNLASPFQSDTKNSGVSPQQTLDYSETNSKTQNPGDLLEASQENFSFLHSQHRQQIFSSKHSDSGYDTLKTGPTMSSDPEVRDLLKFRFDKSQDLTVYPVQVKQGKPDPSKEPWQTKLDESRLIKEYSYQYIKLSKEDGSNEDEDPMLKQDGSPPQNLVQHRIKAFEGSGEEDKDEKCKDGKLRMQDPLRVTSPVYHPNEAHVSMLRSTDSLTPSPCDLKQSTQESTNLRRMRRTSLHGFALGDATLALDEDAKIVMEEERFAKKSNPKSVRDLLADFEKKSQLAKEQLAAEERSSEESPGKRCVFSDTETLLYDTSSDAECHSNSGSVLSKIRRPEMLVSEDDEEDRDEEVAAALGKRDTFFSACRDLGRKTETNPKQKSKADSIEQGYLDANGYKRLSVADSMITHEDLESHCSSPKTAPKRAPSSLNIGNVSVTDVLEEHYMPMTPSKKSVLAPPNEGGLVAHTRSNSASQTLIMENLLVNEESSYVEMTENGMIRSLLAPESNKKFSTKLELQRMVSNTDSACYTEIDQANKMGSPLSAHYELLYRSGAANNSQTEPLYMEVNSLPSEEKCLDAGASQGERSVKLSHESLNKREEAGDGAENPHPVSRAALPDILNSSTNVTNQKQSSIKSDSSDADDEASKDLDSLDAPRHPRFSLSDTFRPASYYLGASMVERTLVGINNSEQQDSSDSDLVSPPPIPTSPPPMDDLETSLESTIDLKKSSPLHNMKNDKKDSTDGQKDSKLWNSTLSHSDDTITEHMDKYFSTSISRLDETISSETDSIESCRRDRLKRRPVSADVLHSLNRPYDLLDLEDGMNVDLDQYLADLNLMSEVSHNMPLNSNHRLYQSEKYLPGEIPSQSVQDTNSRNVNSYQIDSDEVQYENLQLMYPQPPPTSNSLDELSIEHDVDNDTYITLENPMNLPETMVMVRRPEDNQEGAVDQSGAPYYYADLLKGDPNAAHVAVDNINIMAHNSSQAVRNPRVGSMLNNQRESPVEIICSNKRNDVGRKVNQIHGAVGSTYPELEQMDDAARLALELRNSARFLSDKSEFVDERNLYESNTLRRKTVSMSAGDYRSQTPDALGNTTNSHNIYPHGIRDKDVSSRQTTTRRRSRSLEGLLDEPDFQIPPEPSRSTRVSPGNAISRLLQTTRPQTQAVRTSTANIPQNIASSSRAPEPRAPPPPPDVWEEDTLWRENLRRASLRHTRSLDDLDRDTPTVEEAPAVPKHHQTNQPDPQHVPSNQQVSPHQQALLQQQYHQVPPHQTQAQQQKVTPQHPTMVQQKYTQVPPHQQQYPQAQPNQQQYPQIPQQAKPQRASATQQQTTPPQQQNNSCKLSRDVTYVNDSVVHRRVNHREYEEDYREGRSKMAASRQPPSVNGGGDDDEALYERLVRDDRDGSLRGNQQQSVGNGVDVREVGDLGRTGSSSKPVPTGSNSQPQPYKPVPTGSNGQPQPFIPFQTGSNSQPQPFKPVQTGPNGQPQPFKPVQSGPNGQPQPFLDIGWYPTRPPSFEIDREKLRQWDLMSSAPSGMVGAGRMGGRIPAKNPALSPPGADPAAPLDPNRPLDLPPNSSQASGSGSVIGRDPLPPRTIIDKQPMTANGVAQGAGLSASSSQSQRTVSPSPHHPPLYTPPPGPIMRQPEPDLSHKRIDGPPCTWNLQMSAGELLGRTHEELVLLLIQLRRQSAGFCKAMEGCHIEIEAQARLAELETPKRMEHLQKLEDLKRHLLELEKQYEKGKPLVNLVDNMVKLGSLYRAGSTPGGKPAQSATCTVNLHSPLLRERLQFNHKVQEQRLLAEQQRDWDRLSPDHNQLQAKVAQLYRLDKLLQEESGTLHSLQQDKEMLEQALGGLRHKLQVIDNNPVEAERYRKQQRLLERELTRVRSILAHNSKKLEETVAENARLEQELVVLRQKVQTSRRIPDPATGPTTAALEAELRRVQTLVGDLQRQRHELSIQVRQLTDKSRSLSQQIRPGPTGVAGAGALMGKKRPLHTSWLETDLDSQVTRDLGMDARDLGLDSPTPTSPTPPPPPPPLYVNTDNDSSAAVSPTNISSNNSELASRDDMSHQMQYCRPMDISEADDRIKRFYGIIPKDKPQEIKTVRIVKRESERRQRDRDRSGNIGIPLTNNNIPNKRLPYLDEYSNEQPMTTSSSSSSMTSSVTSVLTKVMEEETPSSSVPPPAPSPRTDSVNAIRNLVNRQQMQLAKSKFDLMNGGSSSNSSSNQLSATEQLFGPASPQLTATDQLFSSQLTATDQLFSPQATNQLSPRSAVLATDQLFSPQQSASDQLFSPQSTDQLFSPQLSPVYQSEAARQIIEEMSASRQGGCSSNKRLVPREKRRHHTVSGRPLFRIDTSYAAGGSRDDLDMERALRPRLNAPDVVRSTLSRVDTKFSSETIDNLLGTPNKILIPERYVPETSPELTVEEQAKRSKKADAIRKMLSETTSTGTIVNQDPVSPNEAENDLEEEKSSTLKKKVQEEKRQREHLLQLNQILAQQVMEKSKIVAVKALKNLPLELEKKREMEADEDDLSPADPLPLYQQREQFFS
ncbi:uncharacterized protein LOC111059440 isoform X2 [Nilaparvata lugens]|uniref:uncharacterized protein LOC111059440 isoform X2 n=1 Tax=Nilaparvata lugens TaxID=108931 RepID=UPI00193EAFA4|nr:uncharacterized protein LOC111059440 isoform X2 [Nilaparvata lugens]